MQGLWCLEGPAEACAQLEMITFSVDPQWCGLLFSVYCRHEKGALLGGGCLPQQDAFAACSLIGPPLDADWIAIAGSVGFEICRLSSTCALILESVKATGVILLLGLGSLVCYRIYNRYWPQVRSRRPRPRRQEPPEEREGQLVEDVEDEDPDEIEGRYFGPALCAPDEHASLNVDRSFPCSRSASGSIYPNSSTSQSDSGTSGEDDGRDADVSDGSQGDKSPKQLDPFKNRHSNNHWSGHRSRNGSLDANSSGWLVEKITKLLTSTSDGLQLSESACLNVSTLPNLTLTLNQNKPGRAASDKEHDRIRHVTPEETAGDQQLSSADFYSNESTWPENFQSRATMTRDESYDSLGFSKRLPEDGSFDSSGSELSLDFSLPETSVDVDNGTMLHMEKLQQEIDQLKTNCLMMDEEFETIKSNRNLPGMSSLMKVSESDVNQDVNAGKQESLKQEKARACFAGLYSLTTIKNSTSSELSDSFAAPVRALGARGSIGSAESLDWDSPKLMSSPAKQGPHELTEDSGDVSKLKANSSSNSMKSQLSRLISEKSLVSEDDLMANLEWDEEDLNEYPEEMEESFLVLNSLNVSEDGGSRSVTGSPTTERSKMESSSGFESGSKMLDSCTSMQSDFAPGKSWTCWSSEESGCMEWDTTITPGTEHQPMSAFSQQSCSSNASEMSTPASENPPSELASPVMVENIGKKVNVFQYAVQEWQGNTKKAKTILQGYSEIPSLLGLQHLRRVRGDNYCGVRAAIFQTLSQGLPVPSGAETFQCLSHALNSEGCGWLQDWTFAGRLPYDGNKVLQGMEVCLRDLDNLASLLSSATGDKEEDLATLLNCSPTLDLHVVEAVKLHMLWQAMQLHRQNSSGTDEVPVFAMLMFARDTSETPRDLMNNHLRDVGNTGGLEQVEMFLLGYTLGVTLRVVRPGAYGTEDFVCSYPDWNEGNWPQVILIAEDDRHYNILVN